MAGTSSCIGHTIRVSSHADWLNVLNVGWGMQEEEFWRSCPSCGKHYVGGLTGNACVTSMDSQVSKLSKASGLYGELRYEGVISLAQASALDIGNKDRVHHVIDVGSGLGMVAAQLFFQHPHIQSVTGVELYRSRFDLGVEAMQKLHAATEAIKGPKDRFYTFCTSSTIPVFFLNKRKPCCAFTALLLPSCCLLAAFLLPSCVCCHFTPSAGSTGDYDGRKICRCMHGAAAGLRQGQG
jgi:hypothetical protein